MENINKKRMKEMLVEYFRRVIKKKLIGQFFGYHDENSLFIINHNLEIKAVLEIKDESLILYLTSGLKDDLDLKDIDLSLLYEYLYHENIKRGIIKEFKISFNSHLIFNDEKFYQKCIDIYELDIDLSSKK